MREHCHPFARPSPALPRRVNRDWHNDYAQTLLELRAALNKAPDDASRRRLLQEVRRLIDCAR